MVSLATQEATMRGTLPVLLYVVMLPHSALADDHRSSAIKGWLVDGPDTQLTDYEGGLDSRIVHGGRASAYLRSIVPNPQSHVVVAQSVSAEQYRGRRIRLSAWVRRDNVKSGAGLWLKVLKEDRKRSFAYDNKLVKGSSDWQRQEIVVDVIPTAEELYFGLGLQGLGQAWVDDVLLEIVDTSVPTTDQLRPMPLDLQNGSFDD
jgi:hypothetical protein